ncbi:MAG: ApaLI family restriction endonuclease [Phormidesmis sp.]
MNVEKLTVKELKAYCQRLGIDTQGKKKPDLKDAIYAYEKAEIDRAIADGTHLELLTGKIRELADRYAQTLGEKIAARKEEMKKDDNSHYLIYEVLGISSEDGQLIDEYQNTGRFLYKYAGSFLEEAATLCLSFFDRNGTKTLIENNQGSKPKTFEIDFLSGNHAIELKWRDATTDGDHITKEHTRVKAIQSQGYTPIRVMFYYPQRAQSIRIQETLKTIYAGVNGEYYAGDEAWSYLQALSGYNLKAILKEIADGRGDEAKNNQ